MKRQRYMTMTEMALDALRKAILSGELPPGSQLVPAKLEEKLALSKESIRDAIRQLSGSGLVEAVTNKGSFVVAPPGLDELREIYRIRLELEPVLAVKAAASLTAADIEKLEELNREMTREAESQSLTDHFMLNREFHLSLYQASGWHHLCQPVAHWLDQVLVFRSCLCGTRMYEDLGRFNDQHTQIIEALKAGDLTELKHHITHNLRAGLENILINYSRELLDKFIPGRPDGKE